MGEEKQNGKKNVELVSLKNVSLKSKIMLLKELGFNSDGEYVLDKKGNKVQDKYIRQSVKIDNMVILPGTITILDDNELSLSKYMEENGAL